MTCPRLPTQQAAALECQAQLFSLTPAACLPACLPGHRGQGLPFWASKPLPRVAPTRWGVRRAAGTGFRDESGRSAPESLPRRPALSFSASFPGSSPQHLCPQGPSDCRKQCQQDYYLGSANRCTACVTCKGKSHPPLRGAFQRSGLGWGVGLGFWGETEPRMWGAWRFGDCTLAWLPGASVTPVAL